MRKNFWLLLLGLGIISGIFLVNRFFVSVPDWLAVALSVVSMLAFLVFYISNKKDRKKYRFVFSSVREKQ